MDLIYSMSTYHFQFFQGNRLNAYVVFFLAASFYLYEYVLQVAPSVMAGPMMQTFHVTAQGFGIVSAFYFYAYAPMQLPAGVLFDRYGPRRLMTCALILCAVGSFFFRFNRSALYSKLGAIFYWRRFCIFIYWFTCTFIKMVSPQLFCCIGRSSSNDELSRCYFWRDAFGCLG